MHLQPGHRMWRRRRGPLRVLPPRACNDRPTWWPAPKLVSQVDGDGSAMWVVQVARRDGAVAHVELRDDGSGGLSVRVGGSDDADIELIEHSAAAITLHPRYLSPAGTDSNDRKRVWEALANTANEWQAYSPDRIFMCTNGLMALSSSPAIPSGRADLSTPRSANQV